MKNLANLRQGRLLGVLAMAAALVGCGADGSTATSSASDSTPAVLSLSATNPEFPSQHPSVARPTQPPTAVITPAAVVPVTSPPVGSVSGAPAPQISGVAATTAKVGQAYSFQPSVKDAGDSALTFSISGAPKWTTFSSTTGRLSGTPSGADVGMDPNIIVQVSNGTSTVALAAFAIKVAAVGTSSGSASLSWTAPTENTDGSALTDLSGYVIHYGTVSQNLTSAITVTNPGLTTYMLEDLPAGTYYFSMTATARNGTQSNPSAEATTTIS